MDISEEYVIMCEEAKEIQPTFICRGDYYSFRIDKNACFAEKGFKRGNITLLFRQDQLQEMVEFTQQMDFIQELSDFECYPSWVAFTDWSFRFNNKSWEQLWLAFVMYKKYNKIWNGKEWVLNA